MIQKLRISGKHLTFINPLLWLNYGKNEWHCIDSVRDVKLLNGFTAFDQIIKKKNYFSVK